MNEANAKLQKTEHDLDKIYKDMGKKVAQVFADAHNVELDPKEIEARKKKMEAQNRA